jgi:outer membrane beta-barrel protein
MRNYFILVTAILFATVITATTKADDSIPPESEADVDQIEAEIQKTARKANQTLEKKQEAAKVENLSDLSRLSPFSEVSVIERKFLPKTGRFEGFLGINYLTNDPWYWGLGTNIRLGYFVTEDWGVELNYAMLSNSEKGAIKELHSNHAVATSSLVTTKSYLGADVRWTPIYGKLSIFNQKIIHFDMYFSGGIGNSGTSDSQSVSTIHLGVGQMYALSKSMGVRWDFSWHRFTASVYDDQTQSTASSAFDNLLLTVGVSFFFPGASYR